MIVTTDIANILYRDCESFGIEIVPFGETLIGELSEERITIHVKGQISGKYWEKCFCEVNLCVPDLEYNVANAIRLQELEHMANNKFKNGVTGKFDGTTYRYVKDTVTIEKETGLKCHFVNVRLLFNVLNTI